MSATNSVTGAVVAKLLELRCDVNEQDGQGMSAVYSAAYVVQTAHCASQTFVVVTVVLPRWCLTTLHDCLFIRSCGQNAMVQTLLDAKADATLPVADGLTAIHAAASLGHVGVVDTLIRHRAANDNIGDDDEGVVEAGSSLNIVNARNAQGVTPTLLAVARGHLPVALRLIVAKGNPNSPRSDGVTPLLFATRMGRADLIQVSEDIQSLTSTARAFFVDNASLLGGDKWRPSEQPTHSTTEQFTGRRHSWKAKQTPRWGHRLVRPSRLLCTLATKIVSNYCLTQKPSYHHLRQRWRK